MPSRPLPTLSRRTLLRGLGATGAVALLAACGSESPSSQPTASGGPSAQPSGDIRQAILDQLGVTAPLDLVVALPQAEFLVGENRRVLFGLSTEDRTFVDGLEAEVTVVRDDDLEVVHGPVPTTLHPGFAGFDIYEAALTYPAAGVYRLAVVAPDHAAVGAIQAIEPAQSPVPQVGAAFPSASTPTVADDQGLEQLCTREPDCSMHEVSLDTALAEGRPTVLTVATPAFCVSALCGPVVDTIQTVKDDVGREDVAWIHVEVYEDAGTTPVDLIGTLGLPSEPWTFFIGADGTLVDKLEGPTPAPLVRAGVELL